MVKKNSKANNTSITNHKNNISKTNNKKQNSEKKNTDTNTKSKSKFEDTNTTYEDVIDFLSVSPTAGDKESITWQDQFKDYFIMFLKYGFLVLILTLNFLGLSVSLNCNADEELFKRVLSAIFAFFFGFVYLIINYYTYKVLYQGKVCKMNTEKLFPFKV